MSDVKIKRKKLKQPREDVSEPRESETGRSLSVKAGFKLKTKKVKVEEDDTEGEFLPAVTSKKTVALKESKAEDFVFRTFELLDRLDEERAQNPLSKDSDIMYEFYKATLADTLELIPIAKRSYMRFQNSSNAYAYNGLITKCQELLADLQALNTKGDLLERILDSSINPGFMAIVSNLSNTFVEAQEAIKQMNMPPAQSERTLNIVRDLVMKTGRHLQEVQRGLQADLIGKMGDGN